LDREILERLQAIGLDICDLPTQVISGEVTYLTSIYGQLRRDKLTTRMKNLLGEMRKLEQPRPLRIMSSSAAPGLRNEFRPRCGRQLAQRPPSQSPAPMVPVPQRPILLKHGPVADGRRNSKPMVVSPVINAEGLQFRPAFWETP
jgi:hypothetical protein